MSAHHSTTHINMSAHHSYAGRHPPLYIYLLLNNFCLYRSITCSRKEAYLVERAANGLDALKTLFCDSQPLIMFAFGGLVLPR